MRIGSQDGGLGGWIWLVYLRWCRCVRIGSHGGPAMAWIGVWAGCGVRFVRIDSHGGGLDGWNWLADWVCQVLCEDWLTQRRLGRLESAIQPLEL